MQTGIKFHKAILKIGGHSESLEGQHSAGNEINQLLQGRDDHALGIISQLLQVAYTQLHTHLRFELLLCLLWNSFQKGRTLLGNHLFGYHANPL
ncbi:hypothetical protein ES703_16196 [subsurface metagenome]